MDKAKKAHLTVAELKKYCRESLPVWAETHRLINGEPFSLADYPFLEDIYADNNQEIVLMKSAQVGASEWLVSVMLWFVDSNHGNTYFAFPTMADCGIFVQGRVDKGIEETPYLLSQLRGKTDNVKIKRFGFRNMYFTGTQKRTQVISSPADVILEDEYDEHNPDVHDTVEKRLNNSKVKLKRRISTPTVPDFGIHRKWKDSDQRCWYVKCGYCKVDIRVSGDDFGDRWMNFITDNPATGKKTYCCPECKSIEFNPASSKGYWKANYPEREVHGYSVNKIMSKVCTAAEIAKNYQEAIKNDTLDEFYRSDLGCPFQPKGSRLYPNDIHACATDNPYTMFSQGRQNRDYFLGVDTGKKLHAVVIEMYEDKPRVVYAEVLNTYEEVERLQYAFNPKLTVLDNRPEPTPVAQLHKKFPTIYGAEHHSGIIKPTVVVEKEDGIIGWNKYFSIERLYNYIINKTIGVPIDINQATDEDFYRHLCTYMRIERVNDRGDKERVFISTTGKKQPDHFMFGTILALAAKDAYYYILSKNPIEDAGFIIL